MARARPRSTGCWLLWLRRDLDRDEARAYWRGPHARRVASVSGVDEYRQLHFSADEHGFWPGPPGLGTSIPADWRIDGMPEVAFASALPQRRSLRDAVRSVFADECNAFDRVLAHLCGPGGGRWHSTNGQAAVGARAVVLLRRRPGVGPFAFRAFLHDKLGGCLAQVPGITELRTHAFLPYSRLTWPTPGVAHDNPPHRRYHGALVIGAGDAGGLREALDSPALANTHSAQAAHCIAAHAYAVAETVTVVERGEAAV